MVAPLLKLYSKQRRCSVSERLRDKEIRFRELDSLNRPYFDTPRREVNIPELQ